MATVVGMTAVHVDEITNALIKSGYVDTNGHIILQTRDGTLVDIGPAVNDVDLVQIENLTPANDDVIQRKAGVWTNRTMAQVLADLKGGVPAGGAVNALLTKKTAADYDTQWTHGIWQAYTPVLVRADTQAVLPSSTPQGRWCRIGNTAFAWGQITSTNATTGGAAISLPVPAASRVTECGLMMCTSLTSADSSGDKFGRVLGAVGTQLNYSVLHNPQTGAFKDAAAGASFYFNFCYETS